MTLSKKFRQSAFIAGIRFISLRMSSLVYLMIMARWLSTNEMGLIAALGIGVTLVPGSVLSWLGWVMQQKALTAVDENYSRNIISEVSYTFLLVGFIFCPVLAILYLFLMNIHFLSTLGVLFLSIVVLDVLVLLFLYVESARLNLEFRLFAILLKALLNYGLAIFLYFLFHSIEFILLAWVLTEILICLILLSRNLNIFRGRIKVIGLQSIFKFGIPAFFLFLFRTLSVTIDRLVIGAFLGQEALATYHLNYRIVDVFVQGILTLMIAIFPIFMKLEGLDTNRSDLVFKSTLKAVSLVILSIFPFLIMFPHFIIPIILSKKYIAGSSLLSVLSIGASFDIISIITVQFKGVKGETKVMLTYGLCYFLSQTFAYLILIQYGAIGIAFSRVLGSTISFLYIMGPAFWTSGVQKKIFIVKVVFLTSSMLISLWLFSQFLHVIIALTISIMVLLFESGAIKYFSKFELDAMERGIPSKAQPLFLMYRQIERILPSEE